MPKQKCQDKNKAILEATVNLLTANDAAAVTMDVIAKQARVAKGTLFLYYPGKEALLLAAHAHITDMLRERLEAVLNSGQHGEKLLRALITVLLDHSALRRDMPATTGDGAGSGCGRGSAEKLMDKIAVNMNLIARTLQICETDGLLALSDPLYNAAALFGICRSTVTYCRVNGQKLYSKKTTAKILAAYLHGTGRKQP